MSDNAEKIRLNEADNHTKIWKKWGPYLAERQWGTVREDYSADGDAWEYVTHDDARSKVYRWGEDGIGGICDDHQALCFALALWNGKDPIMKERLFGLSGTEGNHGEDVKEYYFYLDNTPTHSYMKMLYKYPHQEFPYDRLVAENKKRDKSQPEFELSDTGIFNENRYFDVFIEYAKCDIQDILVKITAFNRGPEYAELNIIPQMWFRNTWSWGYDAYKPQISLPRKNTFSADHKIFGKYYLYADGQPEPMFCENESNAVKLYDEPDAEGYFKDGFHEYIVNGQNKAVNPANRGTKAAFNYVQKIPAGGSVTVRLRLTALPNERPFSGFSDIFNMRQAEADEFYEVLHSEVTENESKIIQRQALAGMLWSKQFYYYDVPQWLTGDPALPPPPVERKTGRNSGWENLTNYDIISMPDKWEYPWYASWDLAFHCLTIALVDPHFAKGQLKLLTREWYMHPNGQLPAYEWNFGDVNPPVHAWATWRVYKIDEKHNNGKGDRAFLETVFHKLLLNFTWWVNRKDINNRNIFQGGFLGLDNIGVFDRSSEIPGGGRIEQADGTAWMAMYSLNMMRIALELSKKNHVYEDLASKFMEHFLYIAGAMTNIDGNGIDLWDEDDQFFYDVLHTDGEVNMLKVRSIVGLIPLFAVEVIDPDNIKANPVFSKRSDWFLNYRPDLADLVSRWAVQGQGERRLFSLLRGSRLKRILKRMLDETEFLSDHGVRSLSKFHEKNPFVLNTQHGNFRVDYEPAESTMGLFGGNSNWRGPVWFPVNFLIIESLERFYHYYGDDFKVECPTNSGNFLTLNEIATELSNRLARLFLPDPNGDRPVNDGNKKLWQDEHFKDYILFYEYFHGDSGKGLGASHQTGWTGLIAKLLQVKSA
jgi:hypothetical protein